MSQCGVTCRSRRRNAALHTKSGVRGQAGHECGLRHEPDHRGPVQPCLAGTARCRKMRDPSKRNTEQADYAGHLPAWDRHELAGCPSWRALWDKKRTGSIVVPSDSLNRPDSARSALQPTIRISILSDNLRRLPVQRRPAKDWQQRECCCSKARLAASIMRCWCVVVASPSSISIFI